LFDKELDVEEDDYEHLDFSLDKGVLVTVTWEWDVEDDYTINWYLMEEDEFENWEDDESFDYISRVKNEDEGSGEAYLEDGDYVFVFNNADNRVDVEVSFEATIEWKEDIEVSSTRNRVDDWFPYILTCNLLSLLSFLASVLSGGDFGLGESLSWGSEPTFFEYEAEIKDNQPYRDE